MARLLRAANYTLRSFSSSSFLFSYSLMSRCFRYETTLAHCPHAISTFLLQTRPYASGSVQKSPFEANIIRILTNEIQYQSDYAPPHQVCSPSLFVAFSAVFISGEMPNELELNLENEKGKKLELGAFIKFDWEVCGN